jgi:predicted ATPase/DNA-binding winged helix-turn-helix (wHTH) protein
MAGQEQHRYYEFGPFRVDLADRVLTRDHQEIPLNLKTFQILLALIENAGRVLTKEALLRRVWPETFVEEGNLTKGVFVLRRALGERPDGGLWIETLPKRGYRFAGGTDRCRSDILATNLQGHVCLPAPRNSFVGRHEELSELRERLLDPNVRLLTITGPGGTGKTRLAIEAAAGLCNEFTGGIHFVALASVTGVHGVVSSIARCFGLVNPGGKSRANSLREQLDCSLHSPTLLVLDNFEHLLRAAAQVAEFLDGCRLLKILVTSRSVLHVYGEHEYLLLPLPLPDFKRLPPPEILSNNPAVALFLERVGAINPAFALTADNAHDVAGICARLDGLPLAIELAARMKVLSPADLLERLQGRLNVLTGGPQDAPERQKTLRRTIDWSHGLLDEAQQKLFRRLSVFSGGFTHESAEAVANGHRDLHVESVEGISSLLDHSLLQRVDTPGGATRFTMLETVREYGLEQLTLSGEEDWTRRAHAAYCLMIGEEGDNKSNPAEREAWLALCDAEHDNLRVAFEWLIEKQVSERALRMAVALSAFWESREHAAEGYESLHAALRLPGSAARTRVRAAALWRAGVLAGIQRNIGQSMQLHHEALDIYLEAGIKQEIAFEFTAIGAGKMLMGEYSDAGSWFEKSLAIYRELGVVRER